MNIEKLKAAYEATTQEIPHLDPATRRACDTDLAGLELPFYLYEVEYEYVHEQLVGAKIWPVKVTRFGVLTEYGATKPTISFIDKEGRKACGSAGLFYLTHKDAQAEVDHLLAEHRKQKAREEFITFAHNMMPHLLERIERLETAARQVVEIWDAGDLAAAVRNLNDVLKDYHEPSRT